MSKFIKNNILIYKEDLNKGISRKMIQVLDVDSQEYHIKKLYSKIRGGEGASWSHRWVEAHYELADLTKVLDYLSEEIGNGN